jgi:hypothetical protein
VATAPYLVYANQLKLTPSEVIWIFNNTVIGVVVIDENLARYKNLPKDVKVVKKKVDFNLFDILDMVCSNPERGTVYKVLKYCAPPPMLIYSWLVSNSQKLGEKNRSVLEFIDCYVLNKKSANWFYEFLAFCLKPVKQKIRFDYKLSKGEKT